MSGGNGKAHRESERHRASAVLAGIRAELPGAFWLALPVIAAELGWMLMGVVDLVMVGRLGTEAIAAVGLGNIVFFGVIVCGIGLLMGLDAFVSQAYGAGRVADCHRWLVQGLWLGLFCTAPLMAVLYLVVPGLRSVGIDPAVVDLTGDYVLTLSWSTLPLFAYFALRRYLQGMSLARPAMVALAVANVLNLLGNWLLIEGRMGAPRLGVAGSAWTTLFARLAMVLILGGYAWAHSKRHGTGLERTPWGLDWGRLRELLKLGWPAAAHFQLEVGIFAVVALLAGRLGATALAAHEVVLNVAGVTFMVPFGISSAGGVRVGQAIGRRDAAAARAAGWAALVLGGGFMACAGLTFVAMPRPILGVFHAGSDVVAVALPLLMTAAAFQLFDGLQVVAGGVLRGAGNTRAPMFAGLAAYWVIGLPVGIGLAFGLGRGVFGLWVGLTLGLIAAAVFLMFVWLRTVREWRIRGVRPLDEKSEALAIVEVAG